MYCEVASENDGKENGEKYWERDSENSGKENEEEYSMVRGAVIIVVKRICSEKYGERDSDCW